MARIPILSLPFELLQPIARYLDDHDKKNLRLTCSIINSVVVPQLFSTLFIHTDRFVCLPLIKALAGQTTEISSYVRALDLAVVCYNSQPVGHGSEDMLLKYLGPAIGSLRYLRSVK